MIRGSVLLAAVVAAALLAASAGAQGKPGLGCPPGFDIGETTYAEFLGLSRTQAAIAVGLVTVGDTLAGLAGIDKNGDGSVCVQLPTGFETNSRPFGEYFYNIADNNASKPD
jgi:hypothetical protein